MTALVHDKVKELLLFEIDKGYVEFLSGIADSHIRIIEGDVIKTCPSILKETGQPDLILGNLPYNAASAIILKMIEWEIYPRKAVFTVQNEMADRLCAIPGTKEYSSFSILAQVYFHIQKEGILHAGSFYPPPRVNSAIVVLTPSDLKNQVCQPHVFNRFLKALFISRRKTIRNQLPQAFSGAGIPFPGLDRCEQTLKSLGLDLSVRPEVIDTITMISLINTLTKCQSDP